MKILFGLHGTTHTEIAQAEIDAFKKLGVETETCTYGNWGSASGLINSIKFVFKNAFDIKNTANRQKSDILYLNTALDIKTLVRDSITIFILKKYNRKIKIVLKFHGSQESVIFSKINLLQKYIFRKASLLLVLSDEERQNFLRSGVASDKVQVTANAIQPGVYVPDIEFKKKAGLTEQTNILLFVGRFIEEKGILDLVEACRLLKEEPDDFQLFCLGDGPLFKEVNRLIHIYGLKDNIRLLGHIPENVTRYYYSSCDILILPTYHQEGFPMAVFQAIGAGKPVITTKIRAAADYLTEDENCLWVEKKNPQQLYKQILMLVNDKRLQNKMKQNNLLLAQKFTSEKIVKNLFENFKKITTVI